MKLLFALGLALGVASEARASQEPQTQGPETAEEQTRLSVRVVSVSGDSIYLDVGRDQGLRAGDRLRILPAGGAEIEVLVTAVSSNQARVSLPAGSAGAIKIPVGTPGEAWIPKSRLAGAESKLQDGSESPQHPPWSAPPEEWSNDLPLLAPAKPIGAREREVELRGFTFLKLDQLLGDTRDASLGRAGLDLEVLNLFGHGGILQFDLEGYARSTDLGSGVEEEDSRLRLERFSYAWGGLRDEPRSWEVGRFLQRLQPEFGVLDGAEFGWRLESGDLLGASFGFLPEPTPEMKSGEDLAAAASWRHFMGAEDALALGLGLQKTWHEGESDRDLALASLDWRPSATTSVHGSAWVDVYDGSEQFKDSGAELTEAHLDATRRLSERSGISLFASQLRWPDLLRNEFAPVSIAERLQYDVTRLGLSLWRDVLEKTRLSGRIDTWRNASDEGLSGELRLGVRDRILDRGEVALTLFGADGEFTSSAGARFALTRWLERGYLSLGLESGLYEQRGFNGSQSELWQNSASINFDRTLGRDWDLGLWGEERFGDELQATRVGFSLRRRF